MPRIHCKIRKTRTTRIYNKKNKRNITKKIKKVRGRGGGLMNLVIHEKKDTSAKLPFGLNKLDPASYLKSTRINPNMFRAMYNYGTPYQVEMTFKQNLVIPSSRVVMKPHLFMPDINHYLISLVEYPGTDKARLLWLASYKSRSWEHDILSYLPPSPNPGKIRGYALMVYKYPLETAVANIYKPLDMTIAKRGDEYRNFQIYLAANKSIQPLLGLTKYFKVQYDAGNAMSFLTGMLGSKSKARPEKLSSRMEYREPKKKMERMEKIEK